MLEIHNMLKICIILYGIDFAFLLTEARPRNIERR